MQKDELKQNVKSYAQKFEDGGLRLLKKGQKGVIHAIFSRFGLVLLLLLLQVGLLVSIFRWFGNLLPHYFGGSVVVTAAMVLYLLNSKMDNSAKITWMVVIALFPVVGVPLFFLLRQSLSNSAAAICMIVVMLPFFLFALYEKNGLPLEKIIKNIIQVCFIRPKVRPYETDNFYAVLQRQDILDKEVYRIVSGKNKVKPRRQKAD